MNHADILIVDDEPDVVEMLAKFLSQQGYPVWKASDAEAALEIVRTNHPMIVILNVNLPRMSGLETLKAIKALRPQTTVIMISGIATLDVVEASLSMGAYDYLPKPIYPRHLEDLISIVNASMCSRSGAGIQRDRIRPLWQRAHDPD